MPAALHALTPVLAVRDPRGLGLRKVDYCRVVAGEVAERRVQGSRHDALGHRLESRDPRLWALHEQDGTTPANLRQVYSLSGRELSRDSVDAGFACTLFGEAGQSVWFEDGKGTRRELEYDVLLRPVALHEQGQCSERYLYAEATAGHALSNASGRLLRHDDTAGSLAFEGYSLGGGVSCETRRFCLSTDLPDWPVPIDQRDALLEAEAARSSWCHGPLGDVLVQTDAAGNHQRFGLTVAGELCGVHVQFASGAEPSVLSETRYNAFGLLEEERLGNGVIIQRWYREEDGRLQRLASRRASGESLQDLHYSYDPAGNIVALEDLAQPLRHFANRRIQPRCEYFHDSLYQLRQATGWEAGAAGRGPGSRLDPGAVSNYRQCYRYDDGGNLLDLTHVGAQAHGRTLVAERHSNRCLAQGENFAGGFDGNGNLLRLHSGVDLSWNPRNELREVRPVRRENGVDDWERYLYDAAGQRVRKLGSTEAARRTHTREVRYLPGLEQRRYSREQFDVMLIQAGTCSVRVLHWHTGRPDEVAQDQVRYALADHLGSSNLELDEAAALISHEVFHPFGSTAWWASRNEVEAGYKTVRYSGKERDATGLYYYGARYYRTDWQRWLNPDPAGEVDGLNLYCMVHNGPANRVDSGGRQGFDVMDDAESVHPLIASGLANFPQPWQERTRAALDLGVQWAEAARAALRGGGDADYLDKALHSAFGEHVPESAEQRLRLRGRLSLKIKRAGEYLQSLQGDQAWRLMINVDPNPYAYGVTRESIRGPRVVVLAQALEAGRISLASTLFHESLHAMDREWGKVATSHEVRDYRYMIPGPIDALMESHLEWALHTEFKRFSTEAPDESLMSTTNQQVYGRLINRVAERLGLPSADTPEQRASYYQQVPVLHQEVELHNADFVTGFSMMFHRFVL